MKITSRASSWRWWSDARRVGGISLTESKCERMSSGSRETRWTDRQSMDLVGSQWCWRETNRIGRRIAQNSPETWCWCNEGSPRLETSRRVSFYRHVLEDWNEPWFGVGSVSSLVQRAVTIEIWWTESNREWTHGGNRNDEHRYRSLVSLECDNWRNWWIHRELEDPWIWVKDKLHWRWLPSKCLRSSSFFKSNSS